MKNAFAELSIRSGGEEGEREEGGWEKERRKEGEEEEEALSRALSSSTSFPEQRRREVWVGTVLLVAWKSFPMLKKEAKHLWGGSDLRFPH